MAPFRQLFAFVFFDGDFDTAQDCFADLTDGAAQSENRLRRIEVKDRHELLRGKVGISRQPAPGQQGVGGADGGCVEECHAFVIVMIPLQIRSVNDAENVLLVGEEIFCNFDGGNLLQLLCDAAIIGNGKLFLQSGGNCLLMVRAVFPEVGAAGAFRGASVCHIEHIFQLRSVPGVVDQGDAFRAPSNIAPHSLVPQIIVRAGGGVGPLGVDHELLVVRVLV
ncbi:MAG: hypothetical protein SPD95_12220 [Candidatus Faecousia sp.]|nr:hypothetical protein [Candidatus Faecousia sp.]